MTLTWRDAIAEIGRGTAADTLEHQTLEFTSAQGLGIAERTGEGIDLVYRELLRVGKARPSARPTWSWSMGCGWSRTS